MNRLQISGDLAPNPVSSVDLFAGAIIPGLILVTFYGIWIFFYSVLFPSNLPKKKIINQKSLKDILTTIMPPTLLIITVLGSILFGIATPTESASLGALGSILIAKNKKVRQNYFI